MFILCNFRFWWEAARTAYKRKPLVVNLVFDNVSVLISDVCLLGDKPNQSKFELSEIIILIGR